MIKSKQPNQHHGDSNVPHMITEHTPLGPLPLIWYTPFDKTADSAFHPHNADPHAVTPETVNQGPPLFSDNHDHDALTPTDLHKILKEVKIYMIKGYLRQIRRIRERHNDDDYVQQRMMSETIKELQRLRPALRSIMRTLHDHRERKILTAFGYNQLRQGYTQGNNFYRALGRLLPRQHFPEHHIQNSWMTIGHDDSDNPTRNQQPPDTETPSRLMATRLMTNTPQLRAETKTSWRRHSVHQARGRYGLRSFWKRGTTRYVPRVSHHAERWIEDRPDVHYGGERRDTQPRRTNPRRSSRWGKGVPSEISSVRCEPPTEQHIRNMRCRRWTGRHLWADWRSSLEPDDGRKTPFRRKDGIYVLETWVKPRTTTSSSAGFPWPGR